MADQGRLTLILSDYSALFANELNRSSFPLCWTKLLKKASFQRDERGLYHHFFDLFSAWDKLEPDLPLARLRGGSDTSLCADPCYLHPDRDKLLLFYREIDLTMEEALAIADLLQPLFDDFQASLKPQTPEEWLLEMKALPEATFTAKEGLHGLPVTDALPTGQAAADWTRLWNEIQMLLFDCKLNQQREAAGKLPINSLWFWGAGNWPEWRSWPHVSGQGKILRTLATESNSGFQPEVTHYRDISNLPAINVTDFDIEQDWEHQLTSVYENWLAPAFSALKTWRLKRLDIIVPEWGVYTLTPLSSWRFWS